LSEREDIALAGSPLCVASHFRLTETSVYVGVFSTEPQTEKITQSRTVTATYAELDPNAARQRPS